MREAQDPTKETLKPEHLFALINDPELEDIYSLYTFFQMLSPGEAVELLYSVGIAKNKFASASDFKKEQRFDPFFEMKILVLLNKYYNEDSNREKELYVDQKPFNEKLFDRVLWTPPESASDMCRQLLISSIDISLKNNPFDASIEMYLERCKKLL